MDNQGTPSHNSPRGPQNLDRAVQQREYRKREKSAFVNLSAALKEVELGSPRSRRGVLSKAAECLRRLEDERVNLQGQLTENTACTNVPLLEAQLAQEQINAQQQVADNVVWANIPQSESQEYLPDEFLQLFQLYCAQVGDHMPLMGSGGSYYGG